MQIGFLVLLLACTAQLVYWMADQWRYASAVRDDRLAAYEEQASFSRELLQAGVSWPQIAPSHPELTLGADGMPRVAEAARERLEAERFHRLNRYAWEGAFFLAVLLAAMAVVYAALRAENEFRKRQEDFLAAASHELKSPLASLRLSTETLAMRDPPLPRRAELVQRLLTDLGRMDRMIANILDASRLSGDVERQVRERVDLLPLVTTVADELRPLAKDSGVDVQVHIRSDIALDADPEGVRTIVRNLVHNSIKASSGCSCGVSVRAAQDAHGVIMCVEDSGIGFSPSEGSQLFEKFYRIEANGHERLPGTGLGLFLVRRLAEMDGGTVTASSKGPGRGAQFSVHWPLPRTREDAS